MRILRYKEKVIENDYDPRFSCNGGSYYQPQIIRIYENGVKLIIDDSSCGDFGDRFSVSVEKESTQIFDYGFSNIDGDACKGEDAFVSPKGLEENIHLVDILKGLPSPYKWAAEAAEAAEAEFKNSGFGFDECKIVLWTEEVLNEDNWPVDEWRARVYRPRRRRPRRGNGRKCFA